jgi:hypothetical protein
MITNPTTFNGIATADVIYYKKQAVRRDVVSADSKGVLAKSDLLKSYRSSYSASHTSLYVSGQPSPAVLSEFKVTDNADLAGFYGYKKRSDNSVLLKVARYGNSDSRQPAIPVEKFWCKANLYDKQGNKQAESDVYFFAGTDVVQEWCDSLNIDYPLPDNFPYQPWCWGLIFNGIDGSIIGLKAYVKY